MKFRYLFELFFCLIGLQKGVLIKSATIIFDEQPSSQDIANGSKAVLYCSVVSSIRNQYNVSWIYKRVPVENDDRRYQNGSNLYFCLVDRRLDGGEFLCVATNLASGEKHESTTALFNVTWFHVASVILKRPSDISLIRPSMKSSIILKCGITGHPTPTNFSWFVDSKRLKPTKDLTIRGDRLKINGPPRLSHNGIYTCCAENPTNNNLLCTSPEQAFKLEISDVRRPVLVDPPHSVVVNHGSDVYLHCGFQSQPPPTIIWKRKGDSRPLTNRPRTGHCKRRCLFSNGTLALRGVKEQAEGEYECVAQQGEYVSNPVSVSVKLAYIKSFVEQNLLKVVALNQKFEFHCETPKSLPPANIVWRRLMDNTTIGNKNGHVTRTHNTLVVDNIQQGDLGAYECVASNQAGTESMGLILTLAETAIFGELFPQTTNEGSNVTWTCPVRNTVVAEVVWLKDGLEVVSDMIKHVVRGLTLTIISVDTSDGGLYSCTIKSKMENSQARSNTARLLITERFKFSPPLRDTCITEGVRNVVECSVNRNDLKKFRWKKIGSPLGSHVSQQVAHHSLSLIFNQTTIADTGTYKCEAQIGAEKLEGAINITVAPRPQVQRYPQKLVVSLGNSVMLHCPITNIEQDKVVWNITLRSGETQGRYFLLRNGSLGINQTQLWDTAAYSCSYMKCGHRSQAIIMLKVIKTFSDLTTTSITHEAAHTSSTMQIVVLSVLGGIAYIIMCSFMVLFCCRRKHRKNFAKKARTGEEEKMLNGYYTEYNARSNNNDVINLEIYPDPASINNQLQTLAYSSDNIGPVTVIGKGEFGDIFLSKAPGLFPDLDDDILVMVKSLDWPEMTEKRLNFYQEINLLFKAKHENIVKLLAVCFGSKQPLNVEYLITEYLEWGILKLCLEASKHQRIPKLTKQHKMSMCCQIACALDHLDSIGLRHNDVASRNCVVSSQLLVKLSILGLNQEGFENEYCDVGNGKRLPIRWMAPETLYRGHYSSKSDVWSFAVTCWEIFALGQLPYENYTNVQLIQAFHSQTPPSLPPLEGSKRITSLIKQCCQLNPHDRPKINQIMRKLQSIIRLRDTPGDLTTEETGKSDNLTDDSSEKLRRSDNG